MEIKTSINSFSEFEVQPESIVQPGYLTPPQIATAYNIPASNGAGVKVGIISLGGGYQVSDNNQSLSDLGLPNATINAIPIDQTVGWTPATNFSSNYSTPNGSASLENALDLYCVSAMVPSANINIYVGLNTLGSFVNCINHAVSDNCDVISISWGIDEYYLVSPQSSYGDFLGQPLANAVANNITTFCSSGDYGSESDTTGTVALSAGYPASSPNVIGVGGTSLTLGSGNIRASETANASSGGGISTLFSVPKYQNNLSYTTYPGNVTQTLTSGILSSSPLIGRGVPDISAPMNAYTLYFGGSIVAVGGTSASTPVMAGMLSRFISLNHGRRFPLSMLKQLLYQNTQDFYDLTTGNNASPPTSTGYKSTVGWDAVTGLGSIANGVALYQAVTSAGRTIKNGSGWQPVQNINIKTGPSSWTAVNKVWTKTATGWVQTF